MGSLHSNAPQAKRSIVGIESNVTAVKAVYPRHKVVAIVGHGKCTCTYQHFKQVISVTCTQLYYMMLSPLLDHLVQYDSASTLYM
jgi:hypothetical protein